MYRNVSLRRRRLSRKAPWMPLGPVGSHADVLIEFAASQYEPPFSTRDLYCRQVAEFFAYWSRTLCTGT